MFSCEHWKFLRTPILKNICAQLLLIIVGVPYFWFIHLLVPCLQPILRFLTSKYINRTLFLLESL